jgi:hypothetical protein
MTGPAMMPGLIPPPPPLDPSSSLTQLAVAHVVFVLRRRDAQSVGAARKTGGVKPNGSSWRKQKRSRTKQTYLAVPTHE